MDNNFQPQWLPQSLKRLLEAQAYLASRKVSPATITSRNVRKARTRITTIAKALSDHTELIDIKVIRRAEPINRHMWIRRALAYRLAAAGLGEPDERLYALSEESALEEIGVLVQELDISPELLEDYANAQFVQPSYGIPLETFEQNQPPQFLADNIHQLRADVVRADIPGEKGEILYLAKEVAHSVQEHASPWLFDHAKAACGAQVREVYLGEHPTTLFSTAVEEIDCARASHAELLADAVVADKTGVDNLSISVRGRSDIPIATFRRYLATLDQHAMKQLFDAVWKAPTSGFVPTMEQMTNPQQTDSWLNRVSTQTGLPKPKFRR